MSILDPGSTCMGIYRSGMTGLIVDARDYYRAFHQAASRARRYLLLAGWQFDSEVRLLRGADLEDAGAEVRFLHFLEALCERNQELEVYILAWDFSAIFSMEREWFQDILFNWTTNERIHFRFDSKHALGATHHQKFVIVDSDLAFVGGMDICSDRWDDRHHEVENRHREDANGPFGSYHDIQTYHTGPVVAELTELFAQRWRDSGAAAPLTLRSAPAGEIALDLERCLPLQTDRVAISRTRAAVQQLHLKEIQEIRRLFTTAIQSAERLIYIENQYFSSQAVYWALVDRMKDTRRPRLQIVLILPDRLPFTEELFLGLPQMRLLRSLHEVAGQEGHRLGVFSTVCSHQGQRKMTFIHSKLLLVDDRFLSIGSANMTNRSMGLDTELNMSWEAAEAEGPLGQSICRVRASLLAEHAGMYGQGQEARFAPVKGLVDLLDALVEDPTSRLCWYAPDPALESSSWQDALEPIARVVDPDEAEYEQLTRNRFTPFSKGIRLLGQWIGGL